MKSISIMFVAILLLTNNIQAQDSNTTGKKKKSHSISLSNRGLKIDEDKNKVEKTFEIDYFMLDLGFNTLLDNTNYNSAAARKFIQVDTALTGTSNNNNVFDLRNGKSINVNLWPVMTKIRLLNADKQKIYLSTGVGVQIYNYKFNRNISYKSDPAPRVILDSVNFSKNKLGVSYFSVPLGFTFKTKMAPKTWLVYGVGITGGYRIASWTKQVSDARGKDKEHDKFNFSDFNSCLTAEFGIDGYFRLYASYQVTPLHENALEQYPLAIGFRFGGI